MFRTIEISDPLLESEGLRFVTVKSRALGRRSDLTLFVPRQAVGAANVPMVLLLHGVYGSHWAWAMKGAAHRTASRLIDSGEIQPMVLVMPSDGLWGDGSGYLRHSEEDYERWVIEEVPAAARLAVPSLGPTSPLSISGLSMGGYGALRLAAKFSDRIAAAGGHSSLTHFEQLGPLVEEPLERYHCVPAERSLSELLVRNRERLPPIRFDCGTDDALVHANRALSAELTRSGIPHEYAEFPGGHEWPYWRTHLEDMLRFFNKSVASAPGLGG